MFYYASDGKRFFSKIEALLYQKSTGQQIQYYFHDDVYDKVNWSVEPKLSLPELYKAQAQKLRDKYDYVILCYSGGYDSTQILETFVTNGIKLDKIITVGAFSQDDSSNSDANMNIEAYKNAFPYIQKLGLQSIHEVIDYTKYFANPNQLSLFHYGNDWTNELGNWLSPHHLFWRDIENLVIPSSWKDKKTALVFGIERPYPFEYAEGHYRFAFKDILVTTYGNKRGTEFCDRVFFYWDVNFPDIVVKQLHVIKNVCEGLHLRTKQSREDCLAQVKRVVEQPRWVNGRDLSPIYNIANPLVVKSPKSTDKLLSARDRYFVKATSSTIYDFYSAGINYYKSKLGADQVPPIFTKYYKV